MFKTFNIAADMVSAKVNFIWDQLVKFVSPIKGLFNIKFAVLFCMLGMMASNGYAELDINIPEVDIEGVDENSTGDSIVVSIFKMFGQLIIWVIMGVAGVTAMKNMIRSWNAQKETDQGRWGAVISDCIGSIIMVILVIGIGAWVLTFLS